VEEVVDDTAGDHETRIDGSTDDAPERVPCGGIKPVPEFLGVCQGKKRRTANDGHRNLSKQGPAWRD